MPAKTALASDKIDALAACAVPFRPHCGGIVTRMRNISEYMLVLALCLVIYYYYLILVFLNALVLYHIIALEPYVY